MRLIDADRLKITLRNNEHMDAYVDEKGNTLYSDHLIVGADYDDVCKAIDEQPTVEIKLKEDDWTPCSKDLPEELIPLNVTWVDHDPPSYYRANKDKRFVDTAVYYQGDWYWWDSVAIDYLEEYGKRAPVHCVDEAIEIIAWRHLPESWDGGEDGI